MTRCTIIDPEAQAEFDHAADYYVSCLAGLDRRFANAVKKQIKFIQRHPKLGRLYPSGVRSSRVHVIIFFESPTALRSISIFHTSRDPAEWQRRV